MNYVRASTTHHSICFLLRRVQVCQKWEKLFLPLEMTSTLFLMMNRHFWYCFSNSCLAPPPAHMTRVSRESENGSVTAWMVGCGSAINFLQTFHGLGILPHTKFVCVSRFQPASQSRFSRVCQGLHEIHRGLGKWREERFWQNHLERFLNPWGQHQNWALLKM